MRPRGNMCLHTFGSPPVRFFKPSDPTKLTREKLRVKIEPLFNKYEEPGAWRLRE
jgi:hypothetical protein